MENLVSLFRRLAPYQRPDGAMEETFTAEAIPGFAEWHLARSERGEPAVLVALDTLSTQDRPLSVNLENLRVEHNVFCRLSREGIDSIVGRYSIIQCLSHDVQIQECFLRTIGSVIVAIGPQVQATVLGDLIERLVELFRLVRQPRRQSIASLWSELFVILASHEPATLIKAWHNHQVERCDFGLGGERLEVKASLARRREHEFRLEQVCPATNVSILIGSLFVEEQTQGVSLGVLWDRVSDASQCAEDRLKVEHVCVEALGEDVATGRAVAFDWQLALDSLEFYRVEDIPRLPCDCPYGVSGVQFRSDFRLVEPIASCELSNLGVLHRACLKKGA